MGALFLYSEAWDQYNPTKRLYSDKNQLIKLPSEHSLYEPCHEETC